MRRVPQLAGTAAGICLLALTLRLVHLWQIRRAPFFSVLMGDSLRYDAWAQRLAAGDWIGHDVFYQAPLYPYFLGVAYALFGHDLMLVRIVQALIGGGACALVTVAGGRFFGYRSGIAAGLLLAVYAPAIFFDGLIQKPVLDLVLLCWLLLLVALLCERVTRARCLWAGVALGSLALARENALVLVPVLLVWLWWRGRRGVAPIVAFTVGISAVLAPVTVRNFIVSGEFHLTTSQLGPNFYIGNNAQASGTYVALRKGHGDANYEQRDASELAEQALGRKLGPADVSSYWLRLGLQWSSSHPAAWLRLTAKKLLLVFNAAEASDTEDPYTYAEWSWPLRLTAGVLHFGVLAPLGLLGMWMTRARYRELWILYATCFVYAASVAAFYVLARYRYALVPLLILFAGAALTNLPGFWRRSGTRERWWTAALAGIALVACNWPLLSIDAMRAVTSHNVGYALQSQGRVDEAIAQYRAALQLRPDYADVHSNLGALLAESGDHDEALQHYREALRIDPGLAEAYVNLGIELASRNRETDAIETFRRALEIDPRNAAAHYNVGTALAGTGRSEEAIRELTEAIELAPNNAAAHSNLGILLASTGRLDLAIDHFQAASKLRPGDREIEANLAHARALTPQGR